MVELQIWLRLQQGPMEPIAPAEHTTIQETANLGLKSKGSSQNEVVTSASVCIYFTARVPHSKFRAVCEI
jgi:hypothetical protein